MKKRFVNEGVYCNLYENVSPSFIVTDARVAPNGIEICDLFQFVSSPGQKSTFYLHHIKKAFGADGYRVAICQILCSAYSLHNALCCEGCNKDSSAYKLFECVQHESVGIVDYKEFREKLRNATFVLSPLFPSGERDLDKDNLTLVKYNFSDFEKSIEPKLREDLKKELEPFLLKKTNSSIPMATLL